MRNLLFKLVGVLVIVLSFVLGWLGMEYQGFVSRAMNLDEAGLTLSVKRGSSVAGIARQLVEQGMIEDARLFVWMSRLRGKANAIKAGDYFIEPGMTPEGLLDLLVSGKVQHHGLTLIEGWNFKELLEAVKGNEHLIHTLEGLTAEQIMAKLGYPDQHPEGRFLSDTYHFPRGTTDVEFLQRAYRHMDELVTQLWAERDADLPLKTPYEAIILASIIEKETGLASERELISGVFVRRLKKGMRLQTDPTVIYGLGDKFDGNLRRRDLKTDTPYNTYRRRGLPPTPIAMPGRDALYAALHPAPGDALYFVARGDGSHHFSATLREHNNAVIKYQLKGRKRPFSSSP